MDRRSDNTALMVSECGIEERPQVVALLLGRLFLDHAHCLSGGGRLDPLSVMITTTVAIGALERANGRGALPCGAAQPAPMSRRALACATGLPRETVRRRVERLVVLGLLREVEGGVVPGPAAIQGETGPGEMTWMLQRMVHCVNLLADAGAVVTTSAQREGIR